MQNIEQIIEDYKLYSQILKETENTISDDLNDSILDRLRELYTDIFLEIVNIVDTEQEDKIDDNLALLNVDIVEIYNNIDKYRSILLA